MRTPQPSIMDPRHCGRRREAGREGGRGSVLWGGCKGGPRCVDPATAAAGSSARCFRQPTPSSRQTPPAAKQQAPVAAAARSQWPRPPPGRGTRWRPGPTRTRRSLRSTAGGQDRSGADNCAHDSSGPAASTPATQAAGRVPSRRSSSGGAQCWLRQALAAVCRRPAGLPPHRSSGCPQTRPRTCGERRGGGRGWAAAWQGSGWPADAGDGPQGAEQPAPAAGLPATGQGCGAPCRAPVAVAVLEHAPAAGGGVSLTAGTPRARKRAGKGKH